MRSFARFTLVGVLGVLAGTIAGCGGRGQFTWFSQLPPDVVAAGNEYVIAAGDTLSIHVLGHEEMNVKEKVRPDGRLALLLIGEIEARGKRPAALKAELEGRLKDYIVSPSVVVNVEETLPLTVLVLGEVARPGAYTLEQDPTISHAIAAGGGLTDYASRDSIFVLRSGPAPLRIRFTYEAVSRNVERAGEFLLKPGDRLVVE